MRRSLALLGVLCVCAVSAQAQESGKLLESFKRNFAIASLDVKIQILQDASSGPAAAEMGPLYRQAVDFVLDNTSLIPTDPRFRQLAGAAAEQIARLGYPDARSSVWKLFQTDTDTQLRVACATALGGTAASDPDIVEGLNRFLDSQNSISAAGKAPDPQVTAAVAQALGKLGVPSSFPFLFTAMNRAYSGPVTAAARNALVSLKGDLKDMLIGVLKTGLIAEKPAALAMAMETDRLTPELKGQVAEYAMDVGLHSSTADRAGKDALRALRFAAARALAQLKRSQASPLLVEHLDLTIMEVDRGLADKSYLLEAIAALGAIGTHEAAVRLTQHLVLLNSYTEKGKVFDEQVVLAILTNLGSLGDKVAFDDLMYTQYLNYGASVKKAAREALDKLKW